MTRIVTTRYRYKRPPRKRKAVAIEAPAIVTATSRRPSLGGKAAAEVSEPPAITTTGQRAQPSTPREAERVPATPPANDDRKPAIVTIERKSRFGDAPDLTPEEHQRRGDAADAMWSSLVDRATATDEKSAAVHSAVSAESSSPTTKPAIVTARKRRSRGMVRTCRWSCRCPASRSTRRRRLQAAEGCNGATTAQGMSPPDDYHAWRAGSDVEPALLAFSFLDPSAAGPGRRGR